MANDPKRPQDKESHTDANRQQGGAPEDKRSAEEFARKQQEQGGAAQRQHGQNDPRSGQFGDKPQAR
jgi:hypothetical protein